MFDSAKDISNLLKKHLNYREGCLNLIASENYSSDFVRNQLTSDFNNRYGCYETCHPENREYTGNRYIHEFEMATQQLMSDVFKGKYVDLRPVSGHMAGMSVVLALLEPGDMVVETALSDWGHGLVGPMCQISQLDATIQVRYMPFDENRSVDFEKLKQQVYELKPKLIIFGGSGTIFPEPLAQFRPVADELGILVAYDAAHVTGLIAGGTMENPLDVGADIMFGSTHKSFPGPQGGFVISNRADLIEKVGNTLSPSMVTSHHINRLPALAASLLEMKTFGAAYAQQIVRNTKAFSAALEEKGFALCGSKRGYSETHVVLMDAGNCEVDMPIAKYLEKAGVLCSDDFSGESAEVRLGTQEVTRRGMKEEEMPLIADYIKRLLMDKEDIETVREEVEMFSRQYVGLEYTF
ncbi:aminotransferase class I/II-fold pyridoxal phosphate-dependent enzyme [Ruminococcaceae bacterium OttesenSCG-928-I18]|nr:aminotransferase class I/II-fold pyridoxal phosphate-dependent enzyme [Ruminococcaceae bacterium OttesenSCG-928-I18]